MAVRRIIMDKGGFFYQYSVLISPDFWIQAGGFRIQNLYYPPKALECRHFLDLTPLLGYFTQLVLVGGVPSVFLLDYATKDIFTPQHNGAAPKHLFINEYTELMSLAEKQKFLPLRDEEMIRFYELRDRWPAMHRDAPDQASSEPGDGNPLRHFSPYTPDPAPG